MTKIISFVKQKGGVGASTLSLSTFFCLKEYSKNVNPCLIDLDTQGSLLTLKEQNEDITVLDSFDEKELKKFDIAIIDYPPRLSEAFSKIYKKSDLLIIPTKTGFFDAAATVQAYNYLAEQGFKKKTHVVLNQANHSSTLNAGFMSTLENNSIPYLDTIIYNRTSFHRMQYEGGNIFDMSRQRKAQEEIKALTMELYGLLIK